MKTKILIQPGSSAKPEMLLEIHSKLFLIFGVIRHWIVCNSPYDIMITSIIRPDDKNSVHAYGRGVDFVIVDSGGRMIAPMHFINRLLTWVNIEWNYDIKRPNMKTLMWHTVDKDKRSGFHFHLQCMQ